MSVLRQQFVRVVPVTTSASVSTTVVDVLGPQTATAVGFAENTDHVIRERQVRQNEAGWVVIDGWAGALLTDDHNLDVEIWSQASSAAQKGLEAPLFPSGAAAAADPVLKRVVVSGLLGSTDTLAIASVFGGGLGASDTKDIPALHLRADEFVRLRINTTAGGALGPVNLTAKFDLGLNPADTHRLA